MALKINIDESRGVELDLRVLVVKIGSAVLTSASGELDQELMGSFAGSISRLWDEGRKAIIVSSGAIRAGLGELKPARPPRDLPEKQALAAIGQGKLMHIYSQVFGRQGRKVAQMLLTKEDMEDRRRYLNVRYTLERLFEVGVVPIINENDTTTVDEIRFGDNDVLSAIVAAKMKADLLILLSDVDGLYDSDPKHEARARLIPLVDKIGPEIEDMASRFKSHYGAGGMKSKLAAAKLAVLGGVYTVIANGRRPGIIDDIVKGDFVGTLFLAQPSRTLSSRERWIALGRSGQNNKIYIDDGAREALLAKKTSLLAVGIRKVEGNFARGDVACVLDLRGNLLAKGLVSYSSDELQEIKGLRTSEIEKVLGYKDYDEVIHRDNLVIVESK